MISGISDRAIFTRIRAEGQVVRSTDLKLRYVPFEASNTDCAQIAFSISRKVGNAVLRNRIRRRLRAAFSHSLSTHPDALGAAVVIVLPGAGKRTYSELETQVLMMLQKIEKSTDSTS